MTTRERLSLAAAISAALHALLVAGGWWTIDPAAPGVQRPLEVTLPPVAGNEAPVAAPEPRKQSRPPARKAAAPDPAPRPRASRDPLASVLPAELAPEVPAGSPGPGEQAGEPAADTAAASRLPVDPAGSQEASGAETAPGRGFPASGTITFALTYGRDGFGVGRAVQTWTVAAGAYRLAADAETTGLVDLFRPQRMRWMSKGTLTRSGLRPESFQASRTRRGATEASEARFDWSAGALTYGHARSRASAALPARTLDILSFIYHLALSPPAPGRFSLPITTGSRFEIYEIEVRAEEEIDIPLGRVLALPVRQLPRPGAESVEIWLGAQYGYLPVKIRHFDRDGAFAGEQAASEIRVSDDVVDESRAPTALPRPAR